MLSYYYERSQLSEANMEEGRDRTVHKKLIETKFSQIQGCETTLGVLCPGNCLHERYIAILEDVQQSDTGMTKGLEHLSCVRRLKKMGLFSLKKKKIKGELWELRER